MSTAPCAECDRPVADGLPLCQSCTDGIVTDLREVPSLLAELAITRAGLGRVAARSPGGRSAETPLPVRATRYGTTMQGDRALYQLETTVTGWTRALAEDLAVTPYIGGPALVELARQHRGEDDRDPGKLPLTTPSQLEQAAVWLSGHRHEIRTHEAAHELLVDVARAVAQLRYVIDRPIELRYLGPCPATLTDGRCCGAELRAQREASWVRCPRCRTQFEVAEIEESARTAAENLSYTLADLLHVTTSIGQPVAKTTLYRWARERRIEPTGWQHRDEHGLVRITDHPIDDSAVRVYRIGDVLTLASQDITAGGSAA